MYKPYDAHTRGEPTHREEPPMPESVLYPERVATACEGEAREDSDAGCSEHP